MVVIINLDHQKHWDHPNAEGFGEGRGSWEDRELWEIDEPHVNLPIEIPEIEGKPQDYHAYSNTVQKVAIQQLTTMLTTSKNVLFPGHNDC